MEIKYGQQSKLLSAVATVQYNNTTYCYSTHILITVYLYRKSPIIFTQPLQCNLSLVYYYPSTLTVGCVDIIAFVNLSVKVFIRTTHPIRTMNKHHYKKGICLRLHAFHNEYGFLVPQVIPFPSSLQMMVIYTYFPCDFVHLHIAFISF